MSKYTFNEASYEYALIELFSNKLGYKYSHGKDIERDFKEPLLLENVHASLSYINAGLPGVAILEAIQKIKTLNSRDLLGANETFTDYLQNGVEVSYTEQGKPKTSIVKLIDYDNINKNDFLVVNQYKVEDYAVKIPDIVVFVNGFPLVDIELKSCSREETDSSEAYNQIRNRLHDIPSFYVYNALCVISDMVTTKAGTISSDEDRYMEWKSITGDYEETKYASFETLFEGIFDKKRFLELLKSFTMFSKSDDGYFKVFSGYHQYFAVKKAVKSTLSAIETDGKAGVVWHTQGSGKSFSMVFYAKLLNSHLNNSTLVIITDRNDLDNQLYETFGGTKQFLRQTPVQATDREDLKLKLKNRASGGIIFTTMQKFEESEDCLSDRKDIVLIADEAHRSQYGLDEEVNKDGKIKIGYARLVREGWDNPNVFQICTLKHTDSTVTKRQEVGRGMRLCVDSTGERMDSETVGGGVHDLNKLTVIASDNYASFVTGLQSEISAELYDRPTKASKEYFTGKIIKDSMGAAVEIDLATAIKIYRYLAINKYTDNNDCVTDKYRQDLANDCLAPLPEAVLNIAEGVHKLVQSVFDEKIVKSMFENANTAKIVDNALNDNFYKKEFQKLWEQINHKYAYTVDFDSEELIDKAINHIKDKIYVTEVKYVRTVGEQKSFMEENDLARGAAFKGAKTETNTLKSLGGSDIEYDLVGMVAKGATLTRKTVVKILKDLPPLTFAMFKANPEEFIAKCIKLINEQKATMIVDEVTYNQIDGSYSSDIFTAEKSSVEFAKAFKADKHIQNYVFTDGNAEKSIERKFAEDLDGAKEVCVYAKLPRGFQIPTPVGNYSPDWAIAFNEGTVKHIFFVAETKGSLESLQLRPIEQAKIKCARKLFNELSSSIVRYHDVVDYGQMLDIINNKL